MNTKTNKLKNGDKNKLATKLLRQGIKTEFTEYLQTLGFEKEKTKYSSRLFYPFRRILPERHDLIEIQFDKHGWPEFVINFGSVSSNGIVDSYGRAISANDVRYTILVEHGRLYRSRLFIFGKWFRVSKINAALFGIQAAVKNEINFAINRFEQLDDWFNKGIIGPSMIIEQDAYNAPYVSKHALMEKGLWPPKDWDEDEHSNDE